MEPVTTAISPALNDIQGMENVFAHSAAIKGFPGETLEFFSKNRILIMTAVSALPQRDPGNWVRSAKTPISAFSPPLSAAQRCVGFVLPSWKLGSFGKNPNLDVSLLPSRRLGGALGLFSPSRKLGSFAKIPISAFLSSPLYGSAVRLGFAVWPRIDFKRSKW